MLAGLVLLGTLPGLQLRAQSAQSPEEQGLADLKNDQPQQALAIFQQVLKANPNDVAGNLLAATAALDLYRGNLAVQYAERARALDPGNWKVHTTLVAAYAATGKTQQRDAERELLRKFHEDPKTPEAMQTSGFLLEMFPVKQYRIDAVEYFKPMGKFHLYYRFIIRNAAGHSLWKIDVQSNDFDEASWAKAHSQQAAAGERQFQLAGDGGDMHTDYGMLSGTPNYDVIRARVVQILQAQTIPFPGEK